MIPHETNRGGFYVICPNVTNKINNGNEKEFYRVLKNPILLGRFLELKNYLLYGAGGDEKYFIADESKGTESIHIAPFAAISYFCMLIVYIGNCETR